MPRFSVVVPTYNGAAYVASCLESVLSQSVEDLEVVVVDDVSADNTVEVVREIAGRDHRVRLVSRAENGGTLRARREGVLATTGEYVMLVDQDDYLVDGALGRIDAVLQDNPVDILHFGVSVIAENEDAELAAAGMTDYLTPEPRLLVGDEILRAQFRSPDGFDWNVHHKAFKGDLARRAWGAASDVRLTLSDDLYVCFILCAMARSYVALADSPWYEYHLGRGETFGNALSLEDALKTSQRDHDAFELAASFARSGMVERGDWDECLADVRERLIEHVMNELRDKLPPVDQESALRKVIEQWPVESVAEQLMRFARDDAYVALDSGASYQAAHPAFELFWRADGLSDTSTKAFLGYRCDARSHLLEIERRSGACLSCTDETHPVRESDYARQDVRIFVTTHKDVALFDSDVLQPVQVGFARQRKRFPWALQDDAGEGISELNAMYCELTTQYWAWKNVDAAYYGFCHYRRYFDFAEERHLENAYGEVMAGHIDWGAQERFCLDDDAIRSVVSRYDVITTGVNDVRRFPERYRDLWDHYARAPHLDVADLTRAMEILGELYPDFVEDARAFLAGHTACFCNMFIMRKELFQRYCAWMFPVLDRFVDGWDTTHKSHEALRAPGHIAERLLNIFLLHEQRVSPELRWGELQCVHFEHPERASRPVLAPADGHGLPVVPVVLAADDAYVPMLTTTVFSALKNASKDRFYDVVVFEKDITPRNQRLMRAFFSERFDNASVRFVDVSGLVRAYDLKTSNEHISVETYYRFLIQDVMPGYDKVLYLDSDLIVRGDIARLFDTDLSDDLLAAAVDVDYLGNLNMPDGRRMTYSKEVLGLKDPYGYFQAGVLVLNVGELRKLHTSAEWLDIASDPSFIYNDQDILNAHCQGRVHYLENAWNVMNDCDGRIAKIFSHAPADVFDAFKAAYANPLVIHYAGFEKPWKPGHCDLREEYFAYARETPFYEALLSQLASAPAGAPAKGPRRVTVEQGHERAVGEDSAVRGVLDPIMPIGSRRREVAKSIIRTIRGQS